MSEYEILRVPTKQLQHGWPDGSLLLMEHGEFSKGILPEEKPALLAALLNDVEEHGIVTVDGELWVHQSKIRTLNQLLEDAGAVKSEIRSKDVTESYIRPAQLRGPYWILRVKEGCEL